MDKTRTQVVITSEKLRGALTSLRRSKTHFVTLHVEGDTFSMSGGQDVRMRVNLPAQVGAPFTCSVEYTPLNIFMQKHPKGDVTLEADGTQLILTMDRGVRMVLPVSDYTPTSADILSFQSVTVQLRPTQWRILVDAVASHAYTDDDRYPRYTLWLKNDKGYATFMATSGKTASVYKTRIPVEGDKKDEAINIPLQGLGMFNAGLSSSLDYVVTLTINEVGDPAKPYSQKNQYLFSDGETTVGEVGEQQLVPVKIEELREVCFPEGRGAGHCTIESKEFERAVKGVLPVPLSTGQDGLSITAGNDILTVTGTFQTEITVEAMTSVSGEGVDTEDISTILEIRVLLNNMLTVIKGMKSANAEGLAMTWARYEGQEHPPYLFFDAILNAIPGQYAEDMERLWMAVSPLSF